MVKELSCVDEKITNPQYGICKYSLSDPKGITSHILVMDTQKMPSWEKC